MHAYWIKVWLTPNFLIGSVQYIHYRNDFLLICTSFLGLEITILNFKLFSLIMGMLKNV